MVTVTNMFHGACFIISKYSFVGGYYLKTLQNSNNIIPNNKHKQQQQQHQWHKNIIN